MSTPETFRDHVLRLIVRDIAALQREVAAYPDDASLWQLAPGISNSGGTLALHVAGNLRHFVGTVLGKSSYVRTRDAEFNTRGMSRDAVVTELAMTTADVVRTMRVLDLQAVGSQYPQLIGDTAVGTEVFLMHLVAHLAYHVGQTDYHRRLITGDSATVRTMGVCELQTPLPDSAPA